MEPENETLLREMQKRLDSLLTEKAYKEFIQNKEYFPGLLPERTSTVVVKREEWILGNTKFVLSNGYRQFFVKAPIQALKQIWEAPALYPKIYQLDKDTILEGFKNSQKKFRARIYKKVPIVADQNYTLEYEMTDKGRLYFVRAKLIEDHAEFALRDSYKVIEPVDGGILVTAVDLIYPLSSIVRALGPAVRSTFKEELNKLSILETCFSEKNTGSLPTDETYGYCHRLINKK